MIKFIIARGDNDKEVYDKYIGESLQKLNTESYEVFNDNGENLSIFQKYNIGIERAKSIGIKDDDIICFAHSDVSILDPNFSQKVEIVFKNKSDIGLCGVIGTREYSDNGGWWMTIPKMLSGHIIQEINGQSNHLVKGSIGYFDDMVVVDGLILMIRGKLLNDGLMWDESFDGYHLYDVDICLQVLSKGWKIAVADILVRHKSPGMGFLTKEWHDSKDKIINKYKKMGCEFPITTESFNKLNKNEKN